MGYKNRTCAALLYLVIIFDLPIISHLKSAKLFTSCSNIGTKSILWNKPGVSRNEHLGAFHTGNKRAFLSPIKLHFNTHGPVKLNSRFQFDEKKVKRKKSAPKKSKKKVDKEKDTLEGLANIAVKKTQEDVLSKELDEFFKRAEYNPNKKKLPTPPGISSPTHDALLYLKGLPFDITEEEVLHWLKDYDIVNIILIKNESGIFTGDAYVRCANISTRDTVAKEMANKELGVRYIQIFRVNENAYLEYYYSGYRKEPAKRNFVDISLLVVPESQKKKQLDSKKQKLYHIDEIKTGMRIVGTVTEIYKNGVIVDCDVYDVKDGFKENVICVLKKNRIAKNVGIEGQHVEWLKNKDFAIFPGLQLNLYVEKVRLTTAKKTYDKDIWVEHFSESLISTYVQKVDFILEQSNESEAKTQESTETLGDEHVLALEHPIKRSRRIMNVRSNKHTICTLPENTEYRKLVYLTMDSSVSEDKAIWWEKKILQNYLKENEPIKDLDNVAVKNTIQYYASMMKSPVGNVKKNDVISGKKQIYGNWSPSKLMPVNLKSEGDQIATKEQVAIPLPETIEVEKLPDDTFDTGETSSFERYSEVVNEFFKDSSVREGDVVYHNFEDFPEDSYEDDRKLQYYNKIIYRDPKEMLERFPKIALYDPAIKLPNNGLLLRKSEVSKLTNAQVGAILRLLGKEPGGDNSENRALLTEVITNEGMPTDLSPQTLIQKGLYKVKQSKRSMKKIINLTKHLTGRRFTQEDLDAASKKELQMLVEESLYKFLNWNPEQKVKTDFINNYRYLLDEGFSLPNINDVVPKREFSENVDSFSDVNDRMESSMEDNDLVNPPSEDEKAAEKMWNDLKWIIVINIYGKQSDLEDILKELEKADSKFNIDPNAAEVSLSPEILKILEKADLD